MSKITKVLSYLLCFTLIIATLLSIVDFCCFDRKFYASQQNKLNIAQTIGVDDEDLDKMTSVLLGYLKHENDDLFVEAKVNGINREIFNQKEKDHMIDVLNLYDGAILVRNICLLVMVGCLLILLSKHKVANLGFYYNKTLIFFAMVFAFIGMFCLIDFNTFWMSFHELFFPMNDLCLLDPRTDILIMMVPEEFFFNLVTRIIIFTVISLFVYFVIFKYLRSKMKNA